MKRLPALELFVTMWIAQIFSTREKWGLAMGISGYGLFGIVPSIIPRDFWSMWNITWDNMLERNVSAQGGATQGMSDEEMLRNASQRYMAPAAPFSSLATFTQISILLFLYGLVIFNLATPPVQKIFGFWCYGFPMVVSGLVQLGDGEAYEKGGFEFWGSNHTVCLIIDIFLRLGFGVPIMALCSGGAKLTSELFGKNPLPGTCLWAKRTFYFLGAMWFGYFVIARFLFDAVFDEISGQEKIAGGNGDDVKAFRMAEVCSGGPMGQALLGAAMAQFMIPKAVSDDPNKNTILGFMLVGLLAMMFSGLTFYGMFHNVMFHSYDYPNGNMPSNYAFVISCFMILPGTLGAVLGLSAIWADIVTESYKRLSNDNSEAAAGSNGEKVAPASTESA